MHFTYWIANSTIAALTDAGFELSVLYDWDGVGYDLYGGWVTPSNWEEYEGGVIGSAGFAWWGAYGVNTQEALDADLAACRPYAGDVTVQARVADGDISSLTIHHRVPDAGSTAALTLFGLGILAASRRFQKSGR